METITSRRLGQIGFSLLTIGFFFYVASPLILPVAMGAVIAILLFPVQTKLVAKTKCPNSLVSTALTFMTTILVIIPMVFFVTIGIREALKQIQSLQTMVGGATGFSDKQSVFEALLYTPGVQRMVERISQWFPVSAEELILAGQNVAQTVALKVADLLAKFLASAPMAAVGLGVLVVSLFFFLLDGKKVVSFIRKVSFFKRGETDELIQSVGSMCRGVISATLVSGTVQAILFTATCMIVGQKGLVLIFSLVILSSFIPLLGSTPITLSIALYHITIGNMGVGVALGVVGIIATALDNVIRPLVMKGAANLHPLIAFIGAFGGMQVLGVSGIFIGPIVAGVFVVILKILAER